MMAKIPLNLKIKGSLASQLAAEAEKLETTKTDILERALRFYFDKNRHTVSSEPDVGQIIKEQTDRLIEAISRQTDLIINNFVDQPGRQKNSTSDLSKSQTMDRYHPDASQTTPLPRGVYTFEGKAATVKEHLLEHCPGITDSEIKAAKEFINSRAKRAKGDKNQVRIKALRERIELFNANK